VDGLDGRFSVVPRRVKNEKKPRGTGASPNWRKFSKTRTGLGRPWKGENENTNSAVVLERGKCRKARAGGWPHRQVLKLTLQSPRLTAGKNKQKKHGKRGGPGSNPSWGLLDGKKRLQRGEASKPVKG